jgi:hypothetical protein
MPPLLPTDSDTAWIVLGAKTFCSLTDSYPFVRVAHEEVFWRSSPGQNEDMSTYVLIHGAGSEPWLWHLVVPQLQELGHVAIAVNLPCDDDAAGLHDYAETVLRAAGDRDELILVPNRSPGSRPPWCVTADRSTWSCS